MPEHLHVFTVASLAWKCFFTIPRIATRGFFLPSCCRAVTFSGSVVSVRCFHYYSFSLTLRYSEKEGITCRGAMNDFPGRRSSAFFHATKKNEGGK